MGNQPGKAAELGKHLTGAAARAARDATAGATDAAKAAAVAAQRAAMAVERQGGLPPTLVGGTPRGASHDDTAAPLQVPRYVELPGGGRGGAPPAGGGGGRELDARPSFSTAGAAEDAAQREREALMKRVNERPASFRRLDDPAEGPLAAVDVNTIGGEGEAGGVALSGDGRSTAPLDPEGAEVAASVAAASGEQVSVMRLRPSSVGALSPEAKAALHAKNPAVVAALESMEGAILTRPGDERGRASVAMWEAMQLNPKLLDSAEALQRSHAQLLLAQMALGYIPPEARADQSPAQVEDARRRAPRQLMLGGGAPDAPGDGGDGTAAAAPGDGLVPLAERIDALVPVGTSLDQLILAQPVPSGVAAWGPRPIEGSPYDQLILHDPEEPLMLDRNELFEMYARHRSDPGYWTHERLASFYDTKPAWISVMLESASPPIYVNVDGHAYGVFEVRSTAALERIQAAAAAVAPAAAAAAPAWAAPAPEGVTYEGIQRAGQPVRAVTMAEARAAEEELARTRKRATFIGARKPKPASDH